MGKKLKRNAQIRELEKKIEEGMKKIPKDQREKIEKDEKTRVKIKLS